MSTKPILLLVDDDPTTLHTLEDSLVHEFGRDCRVLARVSPRAALEELERLTADTEDIALLVADQWMPEMAGLEFLRAAHDIHPGARMALLVPPGDRDPAVLSPQVGPLGRLLNFISKPGSWPDLELELLPIIGELLAGWPRASGPAAELAQIVASDHSPRAAEISAVLDEAGIGHGVVPESSVLGGRLLRRAGLAPGDLPAVVLLDDSILPRPTDAEVLHALGCVEKADRECDLLVVGGGPAGLAAAAQAASQGLRTILAESRSIGGQATNATIVRSHMGVSRGISGAALTARAYDQARLFGARYAFAGEARALGASGFERTVSFAGGDPIVARAVLIATGATYRRLGLPRLERFLGKGVFYASGSDVFEIRRKVVCVVGGANAAGEAVVKLAQSASRVTLLVRAGALEERMADNLIREIRRLPNVEVRLETEVVDGEGDGRLERITVFDLSLGSSEILPAAALFALVGAEPRTAWIAGALRLDDHGFIVTGDDLQEARAGLSRERLPYKYETSVPGVFAAGDVRCGSVKRVASAAGEGAMAVQYVQQYLADPMAFEPESEPAVGRSAR